MSVAHWSSCKLGDVFTPNSDVIDVDPEARYQQVTIKLWGRGVVPRGEIGGAEIKGTARTRVRAGQFIISKIDARNGAMGVVPPVLDGALASNDFPTFDVDAERLRPAYLGWLTRTAAFVVLCRQASEGTTNRVRLSQKRLMALKILLPPAEEQDGIVTALDAAAALLAEAQRLCREIDEKADALRERSLAAFTHTAEYPAVQIGDLLTENTRNGLGGRPSNDPPGTRILRISAGTSRADWVVDGTDTKFSAISQTMATEYALRRGDLLACRFNGNKHFVGRFSIVTDQTLSTGDMLVYPDKLIRFRVDPTRALPEYVLLAMNSPARRIDVERFCATTAGNIGISASNLKTVHLPLPPLDAQQTIVDRWTRLERTMTAIRAEHHAIASELEALMPAILDRAFKGELLGVAAQPIAALSVRTAAPVWRINDFAAIQTEIVRREKGNPTLGRKKLYKAAYLAAALAGARIEPAPKQMAAGPFNAEAQEFVEQHAKQSGWFTYTGPANGDDPAGHYRPLSSASAGAAEAKALLHDRWATFNTLMSAVATWDSDKAELIATTHAAWNDLVVAGETISEAAVIKRFYDWSREKTKFTEAAIRGAMGTLRSLDLVPTGGGPLFVGAGNARLF